METTFGDSTLLLAGFFFLLTADGQDGNEEPPSHKGAWRGAPRTATFAWCATIVSGVNNKSVGLPHEQMLQPRRELGCNTGHKGAAPFVMDNWLWTWNGTSFGYRDADALFTHDGVEAGHFDGDDIYGNDGKYIGELKSGKLVTKTSKTLQQKRGFTPRRRIGVIDSVGHIGTMWSAGYKDFPHPHSFN